MKKAGRANHKKYDRGFTLLLTDLSKTRHEIFYLNRKLACSVSVSCKGIKGPGKVTNLFQKKVLSGYEELPRDLEQ